MFATAEQVSALNSAAIEATLKLARVSIETTERVFNAGVDVTRQAASESSRLSGLPGDITSLQDLMTIQGRTFETGLERVLGLSRSLLEVAQQAQQDYAAVLEANVGSMRKAFSGTLEQVSKSALPGADAASLLLKATAETSNKAFESLVKVAKHTVKAAEAEAQAVAESVVARAKSPKAK